MVMKRRIYCRPLGLDFSSFTAKGQVVKPQALCVDGSHPTSPTCAPTGFSPSSWTDTCTPGSAVAYACSAGSLV